MHEESSTKLVFIFPFDERHQDEAKSRGFLSHVLVAVHGKYYPVEFYDTIRLTQDLEEMARHGKGYIADVGLIVLPELTLLNMESAVKQAHAEGFFDHFLPIETLESAKESIAWPPRRGCTQKEDRKLSGTEKLD